MQAVTNVDIERFMGDWYVIANIPTFMERNAVNPLENYRLKDDGTIETTFTFNKNHAQGAEKALTMTAFPGELPNNGIWMMQFIWPIKADYRIVHLDADYQFVIIGRTKRDYLWIMARQPNIAQDKLADLITKATDLGYNATEIKVTSWQANQGKSTQREAKHQDKEAA